MPKIIVQKYGGTSVANLERINKVADNVKRYSEQGAKLVIVVSAMAGQTDQLTDYAFAASAHPSRRELDVLLSSGEQVTAPLLTMALHRRNLAAHSHLGWQLPIRTNNVHGKAHILTIETKNIKREMRNGYVVVVPGFQGLGPDNCVTTFGRGGSDTTAVALAAALKASECQIYTDVDGIYTADPRIEKQARLMAKITSEEMIELAGLGSKVLHSRSVSLARAHKVPLRVLSSFKDGTKQHGTLVVEKGDKEMEQNLVSGIAHSMKEAKISILGIPDKPGIAADIITPIGEANIEIDMIVQNLSTSGSTDLTFTLARADYKNARSIINELSEKLAFAAVRGDSNIAKISVVGLGMRSHSGVAAKMFNALAAEGINIQIISTSEIKISVVIDEKYAELAVRTLHKAFKLNRK